MPSFYASYDCEMKIWSNLYLLSIGKNKRSKMWQTKQNRKYDLKSVDEKYTINSIIVNCLLVNKTIINIKNDRLRDQNWFKVSSKQLKLLSNWLASAERDGFLIQ